MFSRYILLIAFFLLSNAVTAQTAPTVLINNLDKNYRITSGIEYLEDKDHSYTIEQIIAIKDFQLWAEGIPNFATTKSAYWLRIKLRNETASNKLMLRLATPTTDSVVYYEILADSTIKTIATGADYPFVHREKVSSDFIFSVQLQPGTEKYVYLKASSTSPLILPFSTGTSIAISDSDKYKDIFWGLYIGLMLAMLLYNCFVFITTRDYSYLYYILYVLAVLLTQITISGFGFQLLWPDNIWMAKASSYITPILAGFTGIEFMRHFLKTKSFVPKADKIFFLLYAMYGIALVSAFAGKYEICFNVIDLTASAVSLSMLVIAAVIWKKGYRPAGFFLVAWVAFLIGVFIFVFKNLNILPYNSFTAYTMPVGSAMEVILLSFALADRINILKKEKEKHQASAIAALEENEKIISEQKVVLEQRVVERTKELTSAYNNLPMTSTIIPSQLK